MISRHANQFAGMQCGGDVEIFWHDAGPAPLHGWYWRVHCMAGTKDQWKGGAHGPSSTSRDALLDAINRGHVYTSSATGG